jgi:glycosyltransferase involved in cell wall biosynthesis
MRRYGLDVTLTLGRATGIGRVVTELALAAAPLLAGDEELVLVARTFRLNPLCGASDAWLARAARDPHVRVVRVPLPSRLVAATPVEEFAGRLDVMHGPNSSMPATRARGSVVTVHDVGPLRRPQDVPRRFAESFRAGVTDSVRRADRVLTVSDFTAGEVADLLDVPRERIETVRPGVSAAFAAPGDAAAGRAALRARHGIEGPFVLFVGTTNARKNLPRLLDAFAAARRTASLPHVLVVAGDRGGDDVRALAAARGLGDAVRVAGYVAEDELAALYRSADALAFPSLYEGFGLPVMEAMAAGCPVLTSDGSALAETAGGAALLVDPSSAEAIAAGLVRVLTDAPLRTRLAEDGRRRAAEFTWEPFARRHVAIWRALAPV